MELSAGATFENCRGGFYGQFYSGDKARWQDKISWPGNKCLEIIMGGSCSNMISKYFLYCLLLSFKKP
jgi:hypothetical protein